MVISREFRTKYATHLASYLPTVITAGADFGAGTKAELDDLVDLATDATCAARHAGLSLPGRPRDLRERILRLDADHEIVAGVRFKNLDVAFPFVEVHAPFAPTEIQIERLKTRLAEDFSAVAPKGFKFKGRPGLYPTWPAWSHTVFGEVNARPTSPTVSGIGFAFTSSLEWHPQYLTEYEDRLREKPELRGFVRIGARDEFQEAVDVDALMLVEDDHGFAGVVAAIPSPIYGLPAAYVIESYLSKRLVGLGLAVVAHRSFFNGLASEHRHVWGTIYDKNLSSLKTALRTGRSIIETEYFVPFGR